MSASARKSKPKGKKAPAARKAKPKVAKTKRAPKAAVEEKPKAAPKEKVAVEKKDTPKRPVVKAEPVDLGPPPAAVVAARHIDSLRERPARGFSFGELASAGVPINAAKREGLSLDARRRSVVGGNVDSLKGWFKDAEPKKQVAAGKKK